MKNLSIIDRIFFLINCFSLTLLILSYTSPYISPVIFWPIAFLGLLFPILFCINICFLIYWFIKLKKQIWPNIIILLISLFDRFCFELNEEKEIEDTILHEIAHALAWTYDRFKGHGKIWKDWARKVGANPKACSKSNLAQPKNHR